MSYKDPEKLKAWKEANKERIRACLKLKRETAEWKAWNKNYLKESRPAARERERAWYSANKAQISERRKRWRRSNRDRINALDRARSKERYQKNPYPYLRKYAKRRIRIEATIENEHAIEYFVNLVRSSEWVFCYYCQKRVPGRGAHIDHVIALSRGGGHTPENVCASCQHCNLTKSARLLTEWQPESQQLIFPI